MRYRAKQALTALILGVVLAGWLVPKSLAQDSGKRLEPAIQLGRPGAAAGQLSYVNATSGTITQQPQTGALGTRTQTILAANGAQYVGFVDDVIFCGQIANNGTVYMSPVSGYAAAAIYAAGTTANDLSYAIGGSGCDGEDSATEATADEILYANNAIKVLSMSCTVSSSGSNGVVLTLRDDAADLTPSVTITIPTATTTGVTTTSTTTDIAAGSAMALKVVSTEDLSAHDAWCKAKVLVVP